jgi:DNA-binding phage protein
MKRKASISHDEAMAKELRENPHFAAAYLEAASEDLEEPEVLRIAMRRVRDAENAGPSTDSRETS